jgi:phosphoribosyl 1,2-cyclic phosphodiesterase
MSSAPVFTITYWGTTGTLSAPLKPREVTDKLLAALQHLGEHDHFADLALSSRDPQQLRDFVEKQLPFHLRSTYGGNTTCVEVTTPDALIVIDCGSGFRELGVDLQRRWNAPGYSGQRTAHVLVTHAHMDHTFGTPYFDPYLDRRNEFVLYGSASVMKSLEAVLNPSSPLSNTYFPPTFDLLKAIRNRSTIDGDMTFAIGSTMITTIRLRHPGGCLGFRFDCGGKRFVFCTDHEHKEVPDRELMAFADGADLLYLDGQYLANEHEGKIGIMGEAPLSRHGWGHSAVEACVATAVAAGVRVLHVGHREPKRDDNDLARVDRYIQQSMAAALTSAGRDPASCNTCIPWEGLTVRI